MSKRSWFMRENVLISFKHEYRRLILSSWYDVTGDVINMKILFPGLFAYDRSRSDVKLRLSLPLGWPWFPSRSSIIIYVYIYIYIYMYIPYTSSVIGRIYNGSVIQYWRSCTPSRSIGECAVPGLNATFCFLWFTNCVLLFDKYLTLGCLWLLVFVLNILILGIWCSTIPHLPGCFCPWTFFETIGFNTVLTDPFMSHLATQLGYSAGEFQALQLIVLAAFGVVD